MILGLAEYGAGTGVNSTPLLMRASRATLVLAAEGFPAMPPVLVTGCDSPNLRSGAKRIGPRFGISTALRNVECLLTDWMNDVGGLGVEAGGWATLAPRHVRIGHDVPLAGRRAAQRPLDRG